MAQMTKSSRICDTESILLINKEKIDNPMQIRAKELHKYFTKENKHPKGQ